MQWGGSTLFHELAPLLVHAIDMKLHHAPLFGLALVCPLLFSLDFRADVVAFAPVEGLGLTKTFTLKQEFEEGALTLSRGGTGWTIETKGSAVRSMTIVDTYAEMDGAKPVRLLRTFKEGSTEVATESELIAEGAGRDFEASGEGDSRLNDLTVIFAWDGEQEQYVKTYDEGSEGEVAWLAGLKEDMDLRGFLPEGEVAIDDEWDADPSVLLSMFAPGGDLQWDLRMVDEGRNGGVDPAIFSELGNMIDGAEIEGDIQCKYMGRQEHAGAEYLAIEFVVEVDALTDLSEEAEENFDEDDLPEGVEMEFGDMAMELHLEGKGLLLWNARAGHVHSLSYAGESALLINRVVLINGGGKVIENSTSIEVSGGVHLDVTTGS